MEKYKILPTPPFSKEGTKESGGLGIFTVLFGFATVWALRRRAARA